MKKITEAEVKVFYLKAINTAINTSLEVSPTSINDFDLIQGREYYDDDDF